MKATSRKARIRGEKVEVVTLTYEKGDGEIPHPLSDMLKAIAQAAETAGLAEGVPLSATKKGEARTF